MQTVAAMTFLSPDTKAVFCGAAHMDRLGKTDARAVAGTSNPGSFVERVGGAALNSASIFCGLGGSAALHTIIGADNSAADIVSVADQRGLPLHHQTGERTGSYTAVLEPDGDLIIGLADMAIYDLFDASEAMQMVSEVDENGWLFLDANLPAEAIFQLASGAECRVAATTTSAAKAPRLKKALPHIDLLFTNLREAASLFEKDDTNVEDTLADVDVETIVMTRGADPVFLKHAGNTSNIAVPAMPTIRDVTGAGDALAGACLYALAHGESTEQAVKLGILAAQAVMMVDGPWHPDLRRALDDMNGNKL